MLHSREISKKVRLVFAKGREEPHTHTCSAVKHQLALFWTLFSACLHTHTHTGSLGADCVRMISTISANCDVAFCALTVIIADFTDLHTTLPFSHLSALTHLQPRLYHTLQAVCVCVHQQSNKSINQSGTPSSFSCSCSEPKWRLRLPRWLCVKYHCSRHGEPCETLLSPAACVCNP